VREFGDFQEISMFNRSSSRRFAVISLCVFALTFSAASQTKKSATKNSSPAPPDKAFLQKIWDGWGTLNPDNVVKYYATGPNTFFDIAPLKYSSWDEYEKGSKALIAEYKSAKFTLNDDTTVHPEGNLAWITATVAFEMTHQSGKVDMGNMRWTAILENQNRKWMIVHEHVSVPMQ
jgi:ketosteroid isomerase-like protein